MLRPLFLALCACLLAAAARADDPPRLPPAMDAESAKAFAWTSANVVSCVRGDLSP